MYDKTTDPKLKSFLPIDKEADFSIQNLPYGVFQTKEDKTARAGVAIGKWVLDLAVLEEEGFFQGICQERFFSQGSLNAFASAGLTTWRLAREKISHLLSANTAILRDNADLKSRALVPMDQIVMLLPFNIGDYTDFYSSREHATNVGIMIRGKENALQPNWSHLPVAYHGRASSVVVSGAPFFRPWGQRKSPEQSAPVFGKCEQMDFELEMGFFVGTGNAYGNPIPASEANQHIFGHVLVNDWSARDIQTWEYQPLGPFLAKNFATTISPWVVTELALEPFKCESPHQEPVPLPYLRTAGEQAYDINLIAEISAAGLEKPFTLSRTNYKYMYWNSAQQLSHHSINGCNMRTGDLLASGTISGPTPDSYGSMLELAWRGTKPVILPDGSSRKFLDDNDEIILSGYCRKNGVRIGFGQAKGRVLPAKDIGLGPA